MRCDGDSGKRVLVRWEDSNRVLWGSNALTRTRMMMMTVGELQVREQARRYSSKRVVVGRSGLRGKL